MITVLVVDDNSDVRELFELILVSMGYTAIAVPGGRECLEVLKTIKPDIILLDIMMESMDGWETLLGIKASPDTKTIPVIMITGKEATDQEKQKFGGYYADYIVKPVRAEQLRERIEQVLHADPE
jgi:CheY-like chemotaxis protein